MKRPIFTTGECYHIFNRGTDKRKIFVDEKDVSRFLNGMLAFNTTKPIGSIRDFSTSQVLDTWEIKKALSGHKQLVKIIAFCLNPNHFHLILMQCVDGGISEFMKRIGGYTIYFNARHDRVGNLF